MIKVWIGFIVRIMAIVGTLAGMLAHRGMPEFPVWWCSLTLMLIGFELEDWRKESRRG